MPYRVGTRVSSSVERWTCGLCSRSVKTLEYCGTGDWRCIRCVGLTDLDHVTRNSGSPLASVLASEYMTPPGGLTVVIETGCSRCKRPYSVTEMDNGRPIHPHHCDDCTKRCKKCGQWFVITLFLPNKESVGYWDWELSRLGLLSGRENYLDECSRCHPYQKAPEEPSSNQPPVEVIEGEVVEPDDIMARLALLLGESS